MDEIAEQTSLLGLETYRLSLSGHSDTPNSSVTIAQWEDDLSEAFMLA